MGDVLVGRKMAGRTSGKDMEWKERARKGNMFALSPPACLIGY